MARRVFLIVLDSFGIGEMPDAKDFGDEGSNTLASVMQSKEFCCPNLISLGLLNINSGNKDNNAPQGCYARMTEASKGKDTTIGHWEIGGIISEKPLPTYPNGFPTEVMDEFSLRTGRGILCNKPYSGTDVIRDYGRQHIKTGDLIVYTSADSVFQIAAHEDVVPLEELYRYCEIARDMLQGEHGVGRVIARPFNGDYPFTRTAGRHDYSLLPPRKSFADILKEKGFDTIGVGKIGDIFAGVGYTESVRTVSNEDGMEKTLSYLDKDFCGLCFVNLVDFDMKYGHRNDIDGYAEAMTRFDRFLGNLLSKLRKDDLLIITADHGCDPATPSTDHSREYTPMLAYGKGLKQGIDLGTRSSFADIGATVLDYFGLSYSTIDGESFLSKILKEDR